MFYFATQEHLDGLPLIRSWLFGKGTLLGTNNQNWGFFINTNVWTDNSPLKFMLR